MVAAASRWSSREKGTGGPGSGGVGRGNGQASNGAAASVEERSAKSSATAGAKSGSLTASVSSSASSSTALLANGEMGMTGSKAGDYIARELVPVCVTNRYERWALVPVDAKNRYQ